MEINYHNSGAQFYSWTSKHIYCVFHWISNIWKKLIPYFMFWDKWKRNYHKFVLMTFIEK
jgi:hypothetical protein